MVSSSYPPGPEFDYQAYSHDAIGYLMKAVSDYGDIVCIIKQPPIFLVNHPDYIKEVLVTQEQNFIKGIGMQSVKPLFGEGLFTSEGEFHLRQRRLIQPAFHRELLEKNFNTILSFANRVCSAWKEGQSLDIWQEMVKTTLLIIGKILLDIDLDQEASEIHEAFNTCLEWFNVLASSAPESNVSREQTETFKKAKERVVVTIRRAMAQCRAGKAKESVLSHLILARDKQGGMSDEQILDEAITILAAGHETSANVLTWAWYLISQNPEVEKQLHAEVDSVFKGQPLSFSDAQRLSYVRMIFAEAMRLYPPVWQISRQAVKDVQIGDYVLPANATILLDQYVTHHDSRYYPEPFLFKPERWIPEAQAARPKFSYFPFSGGSRLCLGESLAWLEGVLIIGVIAYQWKMTLVPGHPVELQPLTTLRPKYGMRMTLNRRKT